MSALVEVKTWLKAETYRAWYARSQVEGTTVAVLLANAADRAVKKPAPARRGYVRVTAEMRIEIADMHRLGYGVRAIAESVGCSPASVRNHLPKEQG